MKRKLFNKLMKRKDNLETLGIVLCKLIIFAIDIPIMIFGIYLVKSNYEIAPLGVLIVIVAGIVYVFANMKWLVPGGMNIGEFLFSFFTKKRIINFYDGYNTGRIR